MKLGRFRPVGLLGELGLASFSEVPHLAFNFMLYFNFISVTFDEKLEVTEGTRQFTKRLLYCPLSAHPWCFCTVSFGGLILARRMLSDIL